MNWLDWGILIVLAVVAYNGIKRGLIRTVATLAGLIIGIILAGRLYSTLALKLTFIPNDNLAKMAAFAIILIAVLVVAGWAASLLRKIVTWFLLGWLDRLGGAAFGVALGAAICGAFLAAVAKFPFINLEGSMADSWLASILLDKFPLLLALLPEEFDKVKAFFQ